MAETELHGDEMTELKLMLRRHFEPIADGTRRDISSRAWTRVCPRQHLAQVVLNFATGEVAVSPPGGVRFPWRLRAIERGLVMCRAVRSRSRGLSFPGLADAGLLNWLNSAVQWCSGTLT
jgi:hypothetical protein